MPRSAVVISDIDRGFNQYKSLLYKLEKKPAVVTIGILEEDANKTEGTSGARLLDVAIWNEFGTSKIPARSFIREPFERHDHYEKLQISVLKRYLSGNITLESALNIVGAAVVKSFKKNIFDFIAPENAVSTVDKKGFNHPLIGLGSPDGEHLLNAINYRLDKL